RLGIATGPDQGLVGVSEPPATKIGHGIHLAPDDVVVNPEPKILQRGPETKDVVVGPDDPQSAVRLQDAAALGKPGTGETIVVGKGGELVPGRINARDNGVVGPEQLALELQVVGRVGEYQIDRGIRQPAQLNQTVAEENAIGAKRGAAARGLDARPDTRKEGHGTQTRRQRPTPRGLRPKTSLRGLRPKTSLRGLRPKTSLRGLRPKTSLRGLRPKTSLRGLRPK